MKKVILNLFAIGMVVAFSNSAVAQNNATVANATASANIIAPITISEVTGMNFGDIIRGTGYVTLSATGERTSDYEAFSGTQTGTVTAATFTVTGETDYTYDLTLPGDLDVTLSDGLDGTMVVDTFVSNTTGTLTGGSVTVSVGATLDVANNQASGVYTGTYSVTVAYN